MKVTRKILLDVDKVDRVMTEVNILRNVKHVSCKNMVTFNVSISVLC